MTLWGPLKREKDERETGLFIAPDDDDDDDS